MDARALERLRVEACCAMRWIHRRGAAAPFIAGHASVKLDGGNLLVNRFGASFATVMPEDLLVIRQDGQVVEGRGRVNQTIALHGHIHARCPEVMAAVHSHPQSTVALSALGCEPQVFDQETCVLAGAIALLARSHEGLDTSSDVADRFTAAPTTLAVIAPNHGAFTRGPSIEMAAYLMILVEHACRRHVEVMAAARACGVTAQPIPAPAAQAIRAEQRALQAFPLLWADALAVLRASDPDLLALRDRVHEET